MSTIRAVGRTKSITSGSASADCVTLPASSRTVMRKYTLPGIFSPSDQTYWLVLACQSATFCQGPEFCGAYSNRIGAAARCASDATQRNLTLFFDLPRPTWGGSISATGGVLSTVTMIEGFSPGRGGS